MINKNIEPIQHNLFEYDFRSCFYNILKNIGYNVSSINKNDKTQRNIQIGLLMKSNPTINVMLTKQIKNILELYIKENNLKEEEIIWRQKDGLITKRSLNNTTLTIEFELRNTVSHLISSLNRDKVLIIYNNNEIGIKGIRNKPIDLSFFNLFLNLDFSNKKNILFGCEQIRQKFLESNNINWFVRKDKENNLNIQLKDGFVIKVNKSMLSSINIEDIDKNVIYENYIYPFFQTFLVCYNER